LSPNFGSQDLVIEFVNWHSAPLEYVDVIRTTRWFS